MCGQQVSDVQGDYEEQKLLADQRLTELEKLTENYKGSLEDIEKLKMEVCAYHNTCNYRLIIAYNQCTFYSAPPFILVLKAI